MVRIHRLLYMSVESSIPCLCKSVKTFGRTPVSVPQVRGKSCDIRLTRPFPSNKSSTTVGNKPRNENTIAVKFLHEARLNTSYQFDRKKNAEIVSLKLSCNELDKSITLKRIYCPPCVYFFSR